jgi:hypothetical protein
LDIVIIFKPNCPLAKVVGDLKKNGIDLTKQDHIVIVEEPGNILDRHYCYLIENDIVCIAERTANTNVGFVNLFKQARQGVDEWKGWERESSV